MSDKQTVHFIGIGGVGMSGIAKFLLSQGFKVQGTDAKANDILMSLKELGAKIQVGHDPSFVEGADLVIYSSSIPVSHPERAFAEKRGIKIIHRAEALAELCHDKFTIAVTGTHGKTTTTALIGTILESAQRDPSIVVGGWVTALGGNARIGRGKEIVIEADESDSSFLKFSPDIEVITNIEEEHMDHFNSIKEVENAYYNFLDRLPVNGEWFGCGEDSRILDFARRGIRNSTLYGFDPTINSIYATDIDECPGGLRGVSFKVWDRNALLGKVEMKIIGRHNVLNALAAAAVGLKLGITFSTIQKALGTYQGAGRRFDVKYEDPEFLVVDDYAHHPTEIQKTLMAAKALHKKRIIALFQPHRYTRTETFLEQFASSFFDADKLVVTDIYAASEMPRPNVSGDRVCRAIQTSGHRDAVFIERSRLTEYVQEQIVSGDLVITLGAGDIGQVATQLSDYLRSSHKDHVSNPFGMLKGKVCLNEPLSQHTSLKVGGPADFWIEPEDEEDLRRALLICKERHLNVHIFGAGSNLLVSDKGLRGAVFSFSSAYFRAIRLENGMVVARAGVLNTSFIQHAMENGYGGFEFLLGIPGCIGGAIAMNAGSHGQSVDALVSSVKVMDFNGNQKVLKKGEIPFNYRSSGIQDNIILEGVFLLPRSDRSQVQKRLDEYHTYRQSTQDLRHPSAGCMFKNPKVINCSSGKLIEDAGLKGRRIGNAQISLKHANFIINLGGASSKDVISLIEEVRKTVKQKFQVELETEVKLL